MPLENEMKTPAAYVGKTGVLSRAFGIIVVLYIAMGLFGLYTFQVISVFQKKTLQIFNIFIFYYIGYLRFGDDICESITLSLDSNLDKNDRIDIM